jgi:hypothetical protein
VNQVAILYPVFVQVLLTLVVLISLAPARGRSMRANRQRLSDADVELGRNLWSDQATKRANNFRNQFEIPILFYAVVAFALITKGADSVMIVLAWLFVLSRLAHAAVHVGPNKIRWRAPIYVFGVAVILAMWVKLALHVATAGIA